MDKAVILNRVYASNLPTRARTVMFYLINRSNKELTCFPAVPTIARETGLSERTVQRALKELCEEGYVEKISRYRENGGQSSNIFRLLIKEEIKSDGVDNNCADGIENSKAYEEVSQDTTFANTCNVKTENNKTINSYQEMQVVDFSFYDNVSLLPDCHQVGDNSLPP